MMIKLIATGVWICLVTIASSYAATMWQTNTAPKEEVDKFFGGLRSVKTSLISVPVIAGGATKGYVLAQFSFTMKADVLKRMSVEPDVFLLDSAFRAIYTSDASVLRGAKKQDLMALTTSIKSQVNKRFGQEFVEDVLIEKFNYLAKDEVRDGAKLKKLEPGARQ
jgi:hypothetical protein